MSRSNLPHRTIRREDGKLTFANVLRVTLSFSRKGYSETVPAQSTECFLRALESAFRYFGGPIGITRS